MMQFYSIIVCIWLHLYFENFTGISLLMIVYHINFHFIALIRNWSNRVCVCGVNESKNSTRMALTFLPRFRVHIRCMKAIDAYFTQTCIHTHSIELQIFGVIIKCKTDFEMQCNDSISTINGFNLNAA